MKCIKPITVNGNQFNCGYCHACRVNYTSMWTLRCLYELSNWNYATFLTLTYDDDHLPVDNSLHPEDLRNFWKRLRKEMISRGMYHLEDGIFSSKEQRKVANLKYYACGEYGDKEKKYWSPEAKAPHGRPHYHAIVYGLDPYNKEHREIIKKCWTLSDPLRFDNGGIAPVCREDIAYVCGYVQKKLTGVQADEQYGKAQKPFSRVSHGMGLDFALKNKERLINNGFTYLNGNKVALPRYFREKFGVSQEELKHKEQTKTKEQYEQENMALFKAFKEEMERKGLWQEENITMMSIRYERWFEDFNFTLAKQVEKDFLQLKHMRGKL